ncbi:MAG TPA: hypothetical protein VMC03_00415 [Streptosporangiaceae bacterium]|nr:hypothetical protein [Streptosporangiaceae bacterium]
MPDHAPGPDIPAALVAVPKALAQELIGGGLAARVPVLRGAVIDAAVVIGTDAGTVITLTQAPDAIRRLTAWLRDHVSRHEDSIKVEARRGGLTLTLRVDGQVPIDTITDFIADALAAAADSSPEHGGAGRPHTRRP